MAANIIRELEKQFSFQMILVAILFIEHLITESKYVWFWNVSGFGASGFQMFTVIPQKSFSQWLWKFNLL
jgi:hypothetical protein